MIIMNISSSNNNNTNHHHHHNDNHNDNNNIFSSQSVWRTFTHAIVAFRRPFLLFKMVE